MRGLEAERDELLTTVTSLEGAKAMLEAQLQRTQGGSCLKVSGPGAGRAVDLGNLASWGKNYAGLRLGLCGEWGPRLGGTVLDINNRLEPRGCGLASGFLRLLWAQGTV